MSRATILDNIRKNRPQESVELPTLAAFPPYFDDLVEKFSEVLRGIGGSIETDVPSDWNAFFSHEFPQAQRIAHAQGAPPVGNFDLENCRDPHDLALLDVAILRGSLGVAESGAIWLDERHFGGHRALPFIAQHLIIVLEKNKIVPTLQEAYAQLDTTETGFGLFLAGPSKTADIEQSLVIGAHGARSLIVFLT